MRHYIIFLFILSVLSLQAQDENALSNSLSKQSETPRFYNSLAFGFNMGRPGTDAVYMQGGLGFRYAAGYKLNKWMNFGAGTGFEFYDFDAPTVFIPLYAEMRGELTNWRVTPFYIVEVGMGFKLRNGFSNYDNKPKGAYFRPQLGWKFKRKSGFASTVGVGYVLQTSRSKYDNSWGDDIYISDIRRKYQRYFVQFGFEF